MRPSETTQGFGNNRAASTDNASAINMKKSLHVLVAEDNIINQRMATNVLKSLGHTGMVVPDGAQALRCMERFTFDLLLLDVMMPNMDGLEALSALRERESRNGGAHLPVIMATAHDLPGDREGFLRAGADGYVAKPINVDALRAEIKRLLRV